MSTKPDGDKAASGGGGLGKATRDAQREAQRLRSNRETQQKQAPRSLVAKIVRRVAS